MLIRNRILHPRAIWASTTTHPARCRYNSSQSKPPTIEPKSTSTSPDSPPDGIPTFQDLGLPTPPPSAPLFSREKLSDEEIRRTGGNLAKLIRDSIRATGPIPLAYYMRLCLGHPTEGYYTRDYTQGSVSAGSAAAAGSPVSTSSPPTAPTSTSSTSTSSTSITDQAQSKILAEIKQDVFGRKGDFITSPEISQVFGELLALFLTTEWIAQGRPGRIRLVELGPGRGTLMDDVLRTFAAIPAHSSPLSKLEQICLIETSLPLREQQERRIRDRLRKSGRDVRVGDVEAEEAGGKRKEGEVDLRFEEWIGKVPVDKDVFTMVIAHEFFDALPINVFQKTEEGWREVYVNVDPGWTASSSAEPSTAETDPSFRKPNSGLTLALSRTSSTLSQILPATSPRFADLAVGDRVEINKEGWEIMRMIGELVEGKVVDQERGWRETSSASDSEGVGGVGLVVDYGDEKAFDNSFRAFRRHEIVHVFDDPGSADLTANVDFAYLKESLEGVAHPHGPMTQREFLISLGLAPRLDKLLKNAPDRERKLEIANAAKRLIMEDGMGGQYKVMGVTPGWRKGKGVYPFEVVDQAQ
ncbi:S-adenosyl-L-methionine-dependent methyltransferase [Filobasidium floriforme]|uniref:S-adenosyl-L-methionine-dependent methyltransferase n=1 Tax=Filobasidium floriforme TaxID=5210 RepID=UPI001E8CCD2A|nr:S-adenosyl-L-methionine-dependent methyltransferase [Filobasidium floriforme]KAH8088113.1 S-adenosyl-L-methionine-dependent methyltransferase [Filobasidium floriforme]